MTNLLPAATITRLDKVAVDNGFDLTLPRDGNWLGFASTQAPLRLWLTAVGPERFVAAMSDPGVIRALADHGSLSTDPPPPGASGARSVLADMPTQHRRCFEIHASSTTGC